MKRKQLYSILLMVSLSFAMQMHASIITFDDLGAGPVPANYQSFEWNGWGVYSDQVYDTVYANGYQSPSSPGFVVNTYGVLTVTTTGGTLFDFVGAQVSTFASMNQYAGFSSRTVTVNGYQGSQVAGSLTVTLPSDRFVPLSANFHGVDRLEFLNDGGAYHWWTLDNFEYSAIPEPGTMLAGALLLIPVIPSATRLLRKWRKTRTA